MKILQIVCAIFVFLLLPQIASAQSGWIINSFDSNITVLKDGAIRVQERIDVDFGTLDKHGIYRDIPIIYSGEKDNKVYTEINVTNVLQDGGNASYKLLHENENYLRIRIGDADKYISGTHSYAITYTAKGVLRSFSDYDELYWNVTGNYWEAPIQKATATVTLPKDGLQKAVCYAGFTGDTSTCAVSTSSSSANFSYNNILMPSEGMTVAVAYTKGMVPILTIARPKTFAEVLFSAESLMLFVFAFLVSVVGVVLTWWQNGRDFWWNKKTPFDPDAKEGIRPLGAYEPIIVEYTPPEKLRPAEIGVLMDERADTLDVTATIIDLAARNFLSITEIPKKWLFGAVDYELKKADKVTTGLLPYEEKLLGYLFDNGKSVKISSLKTTFYEDLRKVKEKLYEEVLTKKLFASNPDTTRTKYLAGGIVLIVFAGIIFINGLAQEIAYLVSVGAGLALGGILLMIVSRFMPRRSAYGRELYRRVRGYRLFIEKVEKYRQPFFENKNLFNEVLPYAIVFGLAEKFAHAMQEMGVKMDNPTWYHGSGVFNPILFTSNINAFSTSVGSSIASSPKSSGFSSGSGGGGFSGGGFGGGGGGSW